MAFLQDNINLINHKINSGRIIWDTYISNILNDFTKSIINGSIVNTHIEMCEGHIIQSDAIQNEIIICPKIYMIGGASYNSYLSFLDITSDIKFLLTHDYDIIFSLTKLNEINFQRILFYLKQLLLKYYYILESNYYINSFMPFKTNDDIQLPDFQNHDSYISPIGNISFLELNIQKSSIDSMGEYNFINIRCTVKFNNIIYNIIEFNLTKNTNVVPIKHVNILYLPMRDVSYYVPDANSLVKLGLVSLIQRGLIKNKFIKSRQDYIRVLYFITILNSTDIMTALNLYYLKNINYLQILNNIIQEPIFNHCVRNITQNEYNEYMKITYSLESLNNIKIKLISMVENSLIYLF
jgi:hypothetical protein